MQTGGEHREIFRAVVARARIPLRRASLLKIDLRPTVGVDCAQRIFAFNQDRRTTLPSERDIGTAITLQLDAFGNFLQVAQQVKKMLLKPVCRC